jgi:hypothetical protein
MFTNHVSGFRVQGPGFVVDGSICRGSASEPALSAADVLIGKEFQLKFLATKFTARILYYYS